MESIINIYRVDESIHFKNEGKNYANWSTNVNSCLLQHKQKKQGKAYTFKRHKSFENTAHAER